MGIEKHPANEQLRAALALVNHCSVIGTNEAAIEGAVALRQNGIPDNAAAPTAEVGTPEYERQMLMYVGSKFYSVANAHGSYDPEAGNMGLGWGKLYKETFI